MFGRMRHRVTIETQSTTVDAVGQRANTWTKVETVWCSVRPLSGREYLSASGPRAEITHEITFRYPVTVQPKDRILFGNRLFDVESVFTQDERGRYVTARAIENNDD